MQNITTVDLNQCNGITMEALNQGQDITMEALNQDQGITTVVSILGQDITMEDLIPETIAEALDVVSRFWMMDYFR